MTNRRSYIKSAGAIGIAGLAGCTGTESNNGGGDGNDGGSGGNSGSTGTTTSSSSQQRTLKVSGILPQSSFIVQETLLHFTNEVEERTGGDITFELFHDASLGGPGSQIDLINSGAADLAAILPGYVTSQLPLSTVFNLPATFSSSTEGSPVMLDMLDGVLYESELKPQNLKPLLGSLASPYQVATTKDPIKQREDWKGSDIRSGGGTMSITVNSLGGNPVEMPGSETYQALERGTVTGVAFPIPSIPDWDITDLLNNCSTNIHLGSFAVTWMLNDDIWGDLTSEQQTILAEAGRDATMNMAQVHNSDVKEVTSSLKEQGVNMYEVPGDQWASWEQDLRDQVGQRWVNQIDASKAQSVLDQWIGAF